LTPAGDRRAVRSAGFRLFGPPFRSGPGAFDDPDPLAGASDRSGPVGSDLDGLFVEPLRGTRQNLGMNDLAVARRNVLLLTAAQALGAASPPIVLAAQHSVPDLHA